MGELKVDASKLEPFETFPIPEYMRNYRAGAKRMYNFYRTFPQIWLRLLEVDSSKDVIFMLDGLVIMCIVSIGDDQTVIKIMYASKDDHYTGPNIIFNYSAKSVKWTCDYNIFSPPVVDYQLERPRITSFDYNKIIELLDLILYWQNVEFAYMAEGPYNQNLK